MSQDVVLQTVPLGQQWPTVDPFLFCAHHDDAYPAACTGSRDFFLRVLDLEPLAAPRPVSPALLPPAGEAAGLTPDPLVQQIVDRSALKKGFGGVVEGFLRRVECH